MIDKSKAITVAVTLLIAGAAGYVMQNGGAVAERGGERVIGAASPPGSGSAPGKAPARPELLASLPIPPADLPLPGQLQPIEINSQTRVAALSVGLETDRQSDAPTPQFYTSACEVRFSALPESGALVRLVLEAPCYPDQRISLSHEGMEFADLTGPDGGYETIVPALNPEAEYSLRFGDGRVVSARTLALTLDGYERAVINWRGPDALRLHALENGAGFGAPGHVWAAAPRDPGAGVRAEGGFLLRLGNPDIFNPELAEVYSYPFGRIAGGGSVQLIVEAEISAATCARRLSGQLIQLSGDGALAATDLLLEIPPCGGENGFLVLNNLFQNLTLAGN